MNMKKIKIDIVSDIVCPWCIINYKHLERAIAELDLQDHVGIEWQPFFLNPDMGDAGENYNDYGTRKHQRSAAQNKFSRGRMIDLAKDAGFEINFDEATRIFNTRKAHFVIDYAKKFGKQHQLQMRLFEAYFSEQKNISDNAVLKQEMKTVGLEPEDLTDVFNDPKIQKSLDTKITGWRELGITTIPTMIFNEKLLLSGNQTVDEFKEVLTETIM